jgi:hypothetical protein
MASAAQPSSDGTPPAARLLKRRKHFAPDTIAKAAFYDPPVLGAWSAGTAKHHVGPHRFTILGRARISEHVNRISVYAIEVVSVFLTFADRKTSVMKVAFYDTEGNRLKIGTRACAQTVDKRL